MTTTDTGDDVRDPISEPDAEPGPDLRREGAAVVPGARTLPWLLLVGGLLGLLAAADLMIERIQLLIDPSYVPTCSINPVLSCGSVMVTEQARVFGFPNPLIGIAAFSVVAAVGAGMLAGARYRPWFWWGLVAGQVLGAAFVHWLAFQSLYRIGALCPYCMVVWAVTIPLLVWTVLVAGPAGHLGLGPTARRRLAAVADFRVVLLLAWFGLLVVLAALRFWDQWLVMLS